MGFAAVGTFNSEDGNSYKGVRICLNRAYVIGMFGEAAKVPTGA